MESLIYAFVLLFDYVVLCMHWNMKRTLVHVIYSSTRPRHPSHHKLTPRCLDPSTRQVTCSSTLLHFSPTFERRCSPHPPRRTFSTCTNSLLFPQPSFKSILRNGNIAQEDHILPRYLSLLPQTHSINCAELYLCNFFLAVITFCWGTKNCPLRSLLCI